MTQQPNDVFAAFDNSQAYAAAVAHFLGGGATTAPVPVFVAGRPDLALSIGRAETLYAGVNFGQTYDLGVLVGLSLDDPIAALCRVLARRWISLQSLDIHELDADARVLVVGVWDDLTIDVLHDVTEWSRVQRESQVTVITGRDLPSLSWMAAKQYAEPARTVRDIGIFDGAGIPVAVEGTHVRHEGDFAVASPQPDLLERAWRRLLITGHGNNDSIDLGDYTLCGLNSDVPDRGGLAPKCGYGLGCYKDDSKLVPLRSVRSAEITLLSCRVGPIAGQNVYDPRYLLLLAGIDGPARAIAAPTTVVDADRTEYGAWLRTILAHAQPAQGLQQSVADIDPFPIFLQVGGNLALPDIPFGPDQVPTEDKEAEEQFLQEVGATHGRLQSLASGGLLPDKHVLIPPIRKMLRKIDKGLSRSARHDPEQRRRLAESLRRDALDLDQQIARSLCDDSYSPLAQVGPYFGERSTAVAHSGDTGVCTCGRPASRWVREGVLPFIPKTECMVCQRCGDTHHRYEGGPLLTLSPAETAYVGGALTVVLEVTGGGPGPCWVGMLVPPFMAAGVSGDPGTPMSLNLSQSGRASLALKADFASDVTPQAYYFTAFAVQNLAVSTARQYFGLLPEPTASCGSSPLEANMPGPLNNVTAI